MSTAKQRYRRRRRHANAEARDYARRTRIQWPNLDDLLASFRMYGPEEAPFYGPAPRFNPPREQWGGGPWNEEPDEKEWTSPTGIRCAAIRAPLGAWCGYIAVPPGHPWYGKGWGDLEGVNVHYGVTWAKDHTALYGEGEGLWWIGWDYSHFGDLVPGLEAVSRSLGVRDRSYEALRQKLETLSAESDRLGFTGFFDTYRTLEQVEEDCEDAARQAVEAAS